MKRLFYNFTVTLVALWPLQSCQTESGKENNNKDVNTQQETPVKLLELLVGDWQFVDAGAGAAEENQGQTLTFTNEARYIMHSGDQKIDSGAYRMNEQLRNLYLESEANSKSREYEIDLKQDRLTLTPKQDSAGRGSQAYVYSRIR